MSISNRKADHIQLCIDGDVGFTHKTTLLDDVEFIHDALPELHVHDIDLSTEFAGKKLRAPLVIAAMTGGVDKAETINTELAQIAEELGIGFAFGSQRPLLQHNITAGYDVRNQAPTTLLLGNIGIVQATQSSTGAIQQMVERSAVDALCVHLNPAMEVVQPEGDKDFRGGMECLERLQKELSIPLVVKETGCGISRTVAERIRNLGIAWVDVSGAGGTSWVAVETHRAQDSQKSLGQRFWDWGIPTAASVVQVSDAGLRSCATGGIQNGLMAAKAIALGASCAGMARVVLQAHNAGGYNGAKVFLQQCIDEIRIAMLLTGSQNISQLQTKPLIISNTLQKWIGKNSSIEKRIW